LCVIASNAGNFMIEKKPEQCVFATILCVWLQLEVICGLKTWLCLCACTICEFSESKKLKCFSFACDAGKRDKHERTMGT
jgi:hypothetical protein